MALTRDFKQTIVADLRCDRVAYLAQAIESLHNDEFSVGKRMLRNYINGTQSESAACSGSSGSAKVGP